MIAITSTPTGLSSLDSNSDVFRTPNNTPLRKKRSSRPRTPSGQPISHSVKDIRNFFGHGKREKVVTRQLNSTSNSLPTSPVNRNKVNVCDSQGQQHDENLLRFNEHEVQCQPTDQSRTVNALCSPPNASRIFSLSVQQKDRNPTYINTIEKQFEPQLSHQSKDKCTKDTNRKTVCKAIIPDQRAYVNSPDMWFNTQESVKDLETQLKEIKERRFKHAERVNKREESRKNRQRVSEQEAACTEQVEIQIRQELEKTQEESTPGMDVKLVIQMFKELKQELVNVKIEDGSKRVLELESKKQ